MIANRWEQGSDYHYLALEGGETGAGLPGGIRVGSGRAALQLLLEHGQSHRGWRRLWLPTYFCQEVVAALLYWGGEVLLYRDSPVDALPTFEPGALRAGDAVLLVNFFGLASGAREIPDRPAGVEVIEDHTHDPWSSWATESRAEWCIASLRKPLPLPDGGVLWSPRGLPLPPEPALSPMHEARSAERLAAMAIKTSYLAGAAVEKQSFRELFVGSEARIDEGPPSTISPYAERILGRFPAAEWRQRRGQNHQALADGLAGVDGATLLPVPSGAAPYAAMLRVHEPDDRERLRRMLIRDRIYPAVLWSLEDPLLPGVPDEHLMLSRQLLALHCDGRYGPDDMARVAAVVRTTFAR